MSHSTQNRSFCRHSPRLQANLLTWYGKTKPNATKTCIHQSKENLRNVLQHKISTQKTKARFSRFLRHLDRKRRGPILVLALLKFVTYIITYLLRHLPTYLQPGITRDSYSRKVMLKNDNTYYFQLFLNQPSFMDTPR